MSTWIEITDPEDVDYDSRDDSIDILYSSDNFGNNYITVPVEFIIDVLEKNGYKVEHES